MNEGGQGRRPGTLLLVLGLLVVTGTASVGIVLLIEAAQSTNTALLNLCEHYVSQQAEQG